MPSRRIPIAGILMGCALWFLPATSGVFAAERPVVVTTRLADFESAEDVAKWQVRASKPPTLWQLSTEHVLHGKACAKLVTPSVKQSGQRWPAVVLPGKNMSVRDWSQYAYLVFEALNPSAKPVPLVVHTRNVKGVRWHGTATVLPGRREVRVRLDAAAKAPIQELHFFYSDPPEPCTVYLDDVRLETADLRAVLAELRDAFTMVSGKIKPVAAYAGALPKRLMAAGQRIEKLTRDLDQLARDPRPDRIRHWQQGAEDLGVDMRAILAELSPALLKARFKGRLWGYGWTHGVDKVFRQDRPYAGMIGGTLKVSLAANEYEGAQLVLRAHRPLKQVRVRVSDLVTEDNRKIPAKQVRALLVGYVHTTKPPYPVDYVGWWPDPLLDFLPAFDLDADVWQPVWLDVHTSADQQPGVYTGIVTVTAEGAALMQVPLEVTVWDFAVPDEYHFPLAVVFWDAELRRIYSKDAAEWDKYMAYCRGEAELKDMGNGEARRLVEIRRKCHLLILAHHLIPDRIYRHDPPRIDDVKRWKAHGARWFNIIHVPSIRSLKAGQPYPADRKKRILQALADYVPKLKAEGLGDMAYIYGFDEVRPNQFAAIKDIFGEIKKRYPTLPLMTTAYDQSYGTRTGLDPYVDIWVPLTPKFGATGPAIAAARKRGRRVWWYICCGPRHPYANWFVEYTAAEHRLIMGFMPHKFRSDGFLHYSMNFWRTNRRVKGKDGKTVVQRNVPFTEPINRGPLTNSDGKSWTDYNGDGLIFYPGPTGPLSTIRMKCIRDGLEDYEYLWMLKRAVEDVKAGKRRVPEGWLPRAEAALAVDPALVRSLTQYSTNGADLLEARRRIARLLIAAKFGSRRDGD